ncbi:ATP-dependent DNA helicase [Trichonephila clavipes]|nr:ATP-dependent DNA helicase [Trichonephila clavipes]
MVMWFENHPYFETEEGIRLLDQVVSCQLPPESDETRIIDQTSDEYLQNGGRICILKRHLEDRWVNNYNPTLLKHISKSEPTALDSSLAQAVRQIQCEERDTSRKLFKVCMRIMQERQISACEFAFRLCHLNLCDSSRKCIFLNIRKPEVRYRVLKFDDRGQATGYCNNIFVRYKKRPNDHLEFDFINMSLLEYAMLFEPYIKKTNNVSKNESVDDHQPQEKTTRR